MKFLSICCLASTTLFSGCASLDNYILSKGAAAEVACAACESGFYPVETVVSVEEEVDDTEQILIKHTKNHQ